MQSTSLPLPIILAVVSESPAHPRTLGALAAVCHQLHQLLMEADQWLWKRAFHHSTQHMHVPTAVYQTVLSWRELLRDRGSWRSSPNVRTLSEQDLHVGHWMDWSALVAVIGSSSASGQLLLDRLVQPDEDWTSLQRSFLRRPLLTRSCIVDAFGSHGRFVFVDFDGKDLDLAYRPNGGLENCDAVIVLCDATEGTEGAAESERLLRRATAVMADNASATRCDWMATEGPPARILALAGQSSMGTKRSIEALQLTNVVQELQCEVVPFHTSDDTGVTPLLQLLAWSLIRQSSRRRMRLQRTTGHKLLDSAMCFRGREEETQCARRRTRSEG